MTMRDLTHQANIEAKARRALDAIEELIPLMTETYPEITDRLSGLRFWSRLIIGDNNPIAWALIASKTGDEDFRTSRELIMFGLRDRIDLAARPEDPFEGLDS